MASLWTLITKGWDAYEEEQSLEGLGLSKDTLVQMRKGVIDTTFVIWDKGMDPLDEAIQEAHKLAKEIGDPREKQLYDELKKRGLKPLD